MDPLFLDLMPVKAGSGLIVGMILGSLTTMLSHRLPRRQSLMGPHSQCPHCETNLTVRDLVPLFSWLVMKGRCRHCGAKIGARYVLIEIMVTLFTLAAFVLIGYQAVLIPALVAIVGGITGATILIERR